MVMVMGLGCIVVVVKRGTACAESAETVMIDTAAGVAVAATKVLEQMVVVGGVGKTVMVVRMYVPS